MGTMLTAKQAHEMSIMSLQEDRTEIIWRELSKKIKERCERRLLHIDHEYETYAYPTGYFKWKDSEKEEVFRRLKELGYKVRRTPLFLGLYDFRISWSSV